MRLTVYLQLRAWSLHDQAVTRFLSFAPPTADGALCAWEQEFDDLTLADPVEWVQRSRLFQVIARELERREPGVMARITYPWAEAVIKFGVLEGNLWLTGNRVYRTLESMETTHIENSLNLLRRFAVRLYRHAHNKSPVTAEQAEAWLQDKPLYKAIEKELARRHDLSNREAPTGPN